MTDERIQIIKYKNNPEWNVLEINTKNTQWSISSHLDGDVDIECYNFNTYGSVLILNQDELKQVIEFLQSKVIK